MKELTLLLGLLAMFNNGDCVVKTKVGDIEGYRVADGDYMIYRGIPYATLIDYNVFGTSKPYPKFEGVFHANDDSKICPQPEGYGGNAMMSFDCLHLNIHVPVYETPKERLPVLVFIHGGSLIYGSNRLYHYDPKFLVKHDIIIVSINYRLGPFGFACMNDPQAPGNQGFKDQRLALKWVKDNIGAFGGDTEKITIYGESSGATSVDYHLMYSRDFFHKAILSSGSTLTPRTIAEPNDTAIFEIGRKIGLRSDVLQRHLKYLSRPHLMKSVIDTALELKMDFLPCVEKDFKNGQRLISDKPSNTKYKSLKDTPILIGFSDDEGLISFNDEKLFASDGFHYLLDFVYDFKTEDQKNTEYNKVKKFYIGDKPVNREVQRQMIDFMSDLFFLHPIRRTIDKYFDNGAETIYQYMFSYVGERNFLKHELNITYGGAAHADELGYLFGNSYMKPEINIDDQLCIDRITTLWANFVKFGNPTPAKTNLLPVSWERVKRETKDYLNIGSTMTMEQKPFEARMQFWDDFFKVNKRFQKG